MKDQEDRHSCLSLSARHSQTRMSGLLKHGALQFSWGRIWRSNAFRFQRFGGNGTWALWLAAWRAAAKRQGMPILTTTNYCPPSARRMSEGSPQFHTNPCQNRSHKGGDWNISRSALPVAADSQ